MLRKWNRPVITLMNRAVSVPLRGFRGLQDDWLTHLRYVLAEVFQSPCGVLGVCRVWVAKMRVTLLTDRFQSPCGVLGVCRAHSQMIATPISGVVSVPLRGFRGLQGPLMADLDAQNAVIWFQSPCGVLGVCRRPHVEPHSDGVACFSPLAGF